MSEHAWAQEQIEAYFTGGLSADERERLNAHARECTECASDLASATHFDRGLGTLFAPLRPKPGLEDRAVQAVRIAPRPHAIFLLGWPRRITTVAAILIATTTFGLLTLTILAGSNLPLPGERITRETASASPAAVERTPDLGGLDDPNLESAVDLERLSEKTVDDIATTNGSFGRAAPTDNRRQAQQNGGSPSWYQNRPDGLGSFTTNLNGNLPPGGGGFLGGGEAPQAQKDTLRYYTATVPAQPGTPNPVVVVPSSGPVPGRPASPMTYFVPTDPTLFAKLKETETRLEELGKKAGDKGTGIPPVPTPSAPNPAAPVVPTVPGTATTAPPETPAAPEATRRVVIRSGDIEFEIESFDSGLATVTQLVTKVKGAFVGTVNSEKLANGKVRGSITVRVPPEFLDGLVLDLRKELGKGGELKSVRLASQDVTKQYTDTESRLRAARAMETRLLKIISEGKGEIKQLLEAERELGLWRTKIEESEGELRYFASHAALSTLTITLMEKEIRAAVGVSENERVQAGVEVEDVDKAYQQVLKEVLDAKGRVLKSELKQLSAGQFNAMLNFEVAPESGGPIRDRLRQLGRVARLEIDRQQQAEGGTLAKNAPVKRGDTLFLVQLYNLANVAPRETARLSVAVADVPASYNSLRDAIAKVSGRVQVAQLNENDKQNVTAQLDFDIKRADEGVIQAALAAAGDVASRTVSRAAESDQVTDTKILYRVTLSSVARLRPRDSFSLQIATSNVPTTYNAIREAVTAAKGRVLASNLDESDKQNVNAVLDFEVRRTEEAAVKGSLDAAGEVVSRHIEHAPANEIFTDTKVLYSVRLLPANRLPPRETTVLGLEVADVDSAVAVFTAQFNEVKGRQIDAKTGRERSGKTSARLVYEVPLATASGLVERFKSAGTVRVLNTARDTQAPEGKSATARIEITLANADAIVETEDGLWSPVKKGLTYSASFLLRTMTWVIFVLCAVLPWVVLLYVGYRLVRRSMRSSTTPVPSSPGSSTT